MGFTPPVIGAKTWDSPPKKTIMAQAIEFTNWSDEGFTWYYDSEEYSFKAGQSVMLPQHLAKHFAKHLTDREMKKRQISTGLPIREQYEAKCLDPNTVIESESDAKLTTALLNKVEEAEAKEENKEALKVEESQSDAWCVECGSKGGRHKKGCPTTTEEETFEGLE